MDKSPGSSARLAIMAEVDKTNVNIDDIVYVRNATFPRVLAQVIGLSQQFCVVQYLGVRKPEPVFLPWNDVQNFKDVRKELEKVAAQSKFLADCLAKAEEYFDYKLMHHIAEEKAIGDSEEFKTAFNMVLSSKENLQLFDQETKAKIAERYFEILEAHCDAVEEEAVKEKEKEQNDASESEEPAEDTENDNSSPEKLGPWKPLFG